MFNLVIDIGNSKCKLGIYKGRVLESYQVIEKDNLDVIGQVIKGFPLRAAIVSSVDEEVEEIENLLGQTTLTRFDTADRAQLKNRYGTPATLGLDRWAALIGTQAQFPGKDCLIVDAGTSITYDFLPASGIYTGGSISPGINMRFKALHEFTGRLPLVAFNGQETKVPFGDNTVHAISNGVLQGILHELSGFIAEYESKHKGLTVVMTGGDAPFLIANIKNTIFAPRIVHEPYLVLSGLNEVIES